MKRNIITAFCLSIIVFCANWSDPGNNIDGRKKQTINFSGKLTTQQGDVLSIENISIGLLYKQIPVYEMPTKEEKKTTLMQDPLQGIITRIDLSEVAEIIIPEPTVIWTFQKKERSRKTEYIEIVIISKDQQRTTHHYLIDLHRKISCDEINAAGPIEKDIPLPAIKKLVIETYTMRESSPTSPKCPPCPVTKELDKKA